MAQSLAKNYVHIIFSTKHREPLIDEAIEQQLFNYMGGICKALECYPVQIGGCADHIHILCILSRKITLMKLVEEVKSHSSKWIKTKGENYKHFYWQNGYGAFSVSPTHVEAVRKYILNQRQHHDTHEFKNEFLGFLHKYDIEYDEKYIWD